MATNYIAPTWRMPRNANQSKQSNYSIDFERSSASYIDLETIDITGSCTISFWINFNSISHAYQKIFFAGTSASDQFSIGFATTNQGVAVNTIFASGQEAAAGTKSLSNNSISTNTWYNVVITKTTGVVQNMYLNGVDDTNTPTGFWWGGAPNVTRIGDSGNALDAKLDEVAIFDYVLSQDQVTYLYNLNNPMAITGAKPVAYYSLGDNSNLTALKPFDVPNLSVGGYDLKWVKNNSSYTSGDSINIPGINKALAGATSMSMTFWVYLTPAVYNNGMVFRMDAGSGVIQLRFVRYGNARGPVWIFSMGDGTNTSGPAGSTSTATRPNYYNSDFLATPTGGSNTWWNITCTWDGSTMYIYRNGSTQAARWGTYTGIIPSDANSTAFLGASATGSSSTGGLFMDGRISNVAFWRNYSLTQTEVREVYNNGAPLNLNNFSGNSPEAWYKLGSSAIFNSNWSVDNNAYPSVYKSSLNFNGSSNYIDCGDPNDLSFGNGTTDSPFSISAWVNMTDATKFRIVAKIGGNGDEYLFATNASDLISLNLYDNSINARIAKQYTTALTSYQDQWIHLVCTYNGTASSSGIKIYLNSSLLTTDDNNSGTYVAMENTTQPLRIGEKTGTYANGKISNTAIFNTELTSSEVTTIYNNGTPEASISHSPVSWYKLDNTTTGVQDSAGSNNGTNIGATEYAGFVNSLAGESSGMTSANLVQSDLYRTTPYSNYSINFDSPSGDYFNFNNASSNIMANKNTISISAWFKLDSNTTSSVVSNWYGGGSSQYLIRYNTGANLGIQWYVKIGSTTHRIDSNYYPSVGDWVHVVGVKDPITNGGQIRVYINTLEYSLNDTNISNPIFSNNGSDQIGVFNDASSFMDGSISNVAYWTNTALTQDEVTEIYNAGVTTNLSNFSGTAPDHWCTLDSKKVYYDGSVIVARDAISTLQATGVNLVQENIVGNAPGSNSNGTGFNLDISDLKGDMSNSTKNAKSINMADYGDPNAQGVTPANSGRTTSVPG